VAEEETPSGRRTSLATRFKFLKEILPVSSSSNSRNAFRISSLESFSLIFAVIICRNSSKSIVPEPSLSMSAIIFLISSFLGSKPSARIATFSSLASMVPEPSVSNRSKASRISCFCSSVNSGFPPLALPPLAPPRAADMLPFVTTTPELTYFSSRETEER